MLRSGDGLLRESPREIPSRCLCCPQPRQLGVFRNGPRTQLAVCPATRAALILFDSMPAIATGLYTGSMDGV